MNAVSAIAISEVRLRHVSDRKPGWQRKRSGANFRYLTAEGKAVGREELKRIRALVIPPAWEQVWICPEANGHIQATGRDAKGRKQYIYHAQWHATRKETKFHRLVQFAQKLPKIRKRVGKDLRLPGLPKDKVVAVVVRLLEETHIRIGNTEYAERNHSFGLSTLRNKHVAVHGTRVEFKFRGKSGKFHEIDFKNERLARIVKRCHDLPGNMLFEYLNEAGEIHGVTSGDVNRYLHATAGEEFSAKDFRTWAGTIHAARILLRMTGEKKPSERALVSAIDGVAAELGNTRSVCRKYYIHPAVTEAYLGGTLAGWFGGDGEGRRGGLGLHESVVLRLLKKHGMG